MKKTYRMRKLDCANCAAKMERAIGKLEGVHTVSVSFLMQKLTLDADDEQFAEIIEKAACICRKIEPACEVVR